MPACVSLMVAQGCLHSSGIHFASDETKGKETIGKKMSMASMMGAWLGPRVETGEMHTMASASLLHQQVGTWREWPRAARRLLA